MFIGLTPRSRHDRDKLGMALSRLAAEGASFRAETDLDSGQIIVMSRDETQFDALVTRLRREFDIETSVSAPQPACRETISREQQVSYTHQRTTGGKRQFACVTLVITPAQPGEGCSFAPRIAAGSVPEAYVSAVEKGVQSVMQSGPLAGFPLIGVKVLLIDAAQHDSDSSELAFEIAGRAAMRDGLKGAGATLLEPIMKVEVASPERCAASIVGDMISRRGIVTGQDNRGSDVLITAMVPLGNLFGYTNALKSMTSGRGSFTAEYCHHAAITPEVPDPDDNFPGAMAMRA
jgi:elongation factor G